MTGRIEAKWMSTVLAGVSRALLGAVLLFVSPSGMAFADRQQKCANNGAVTDAANHPGLVADCAVLLDVKKTLKGKDGRKLNWSASRPMDQWDGIGIENNRVTGIYLRDWGLKGKIPKRLAELSALRALVLWYNDLHGRIPKELGTLSELRDLYLMVNELTGKIPPELGNLSKLEDLFLDWNDLHGRIPKRLRNLSKLERLGVSHNELTGEIPKWLGRLSRLTDLYLDYNELSGQIPSQLGRLSNLTYLSLAHNELSGQIPSELGALPRLKTLALYWNYLIGCVPQSLRNVEYAGWTYTWAGTHAGRKLPWCR